MSRKMSLFLFSTISPAPYESRQLGWKKPNSVGLKFFVEPWLFLLGSPGSPLLPLSLGGLVLLRSGCLAPIVRSMAYGIMVITE